VRARRNAKTRRCTSPFAQHRDTPSRWRMSLTLVWRVGVCMYMSPLPSPRNARGRRPRGRQHEPRLAGRYGVQSPAPALLIVAVAALPHSVHEAVQQMIEEHSEVQASMSAALLGLSVVVSAAMGSRSHCFAVEKARQLQILDSKLDARRQARLCVCPPACFTFMWIYRHGCVAGLEPRPCH
jgi:hypothetical protein